MFYFVCKGVVMFESLILKQGLSSIVMYMYTFTIIYTFIFIALIICVY